MSERERGDPPLDVLIVGAGISGLGLACHLQQKLPGKSWLILESRDTFGGTWDLFRYPGIRSDSDLYTFAYDFKPWKSRNAIAGAGEILGYLKETIAEYDLAGRIRYGVRVVSADWDSACGLWKVKAHDRGLGQDVEFRCRWLFGATGYYDYEQGHRPRFEGEETFKGQIVHPQSWPRDLDVSGQRVAVIGSGATAFTLSPALAQKAAHVTQIQRTPSYVLPMPAEDGIANLLRRFLPADLVHRLVRRKNIWRQQVIYALCQRYPSQARKFIRWANVKSLPEGYPVDEHFKPPYDPWDQRLCAVPDGDFFKAIRRGKLSIVTDAIERFNETGLRMRSGRQIDADIVVTATGLQLKLFGGVELRVDGANVRPAERLIFKGMMLDGVPNFGCAVGYTNSTWTLKIGLLCEYFCRLLAELDARGDNVCVAQRPEGETGARPLLDFGAGYVQRSLADLPRQGVDYPWVMSFNYASDTRILKRGAVIDPAMRLSRVAKSAVETAPEREAAE